MGQSSELVSEGSRGFKTALSWSDMTERRRVLAIRVIREDETTEPCRQGGAVVSESLGVLVF